MKASDSFPVISKSGVLEWEETKKEKHQQQQNQHKSLAKKETVKQDNNKTAKKRYLQLKIKKRNKQRYSSFENEGTRPVFIYGKSNHAI